MRLALIEDNDAYQYEIKKRLSKDFVIDSFEYHGEFLRALAQKRENYFCIICDRYTGSDALDFGGDKSLPEIIREKCKDVLIVLISASYIDESDTSGFDFVAKKTKAGYRELEEFLKRKQSSWLD